MSDTKPSIFRRFAPLIFFIILAALLGFGLTLNPRLVPSPLINKPVPKFTLPLLNQAGSFSDKDLKGHITLVNVWASWCFVCRQEHAEVKRLSRQGIRIIGFNYKDKAADAKAWLQRLGNPYRKVIVDRTGRVAIDWGVYGAPETFLVDRHGIIRYKVIGSLADPDNLKALLKKMKALK